MNTAAAALVVVAVTAATAGCGGSSAASTPTANAKDAVTVVVDRAAAAAAHGAGVDLKALVGRSATRAFSLLPHRGRVTIHVSLDPTRTIPQVGIGGATDPHTGNVSIAISGRPPEGLRAMLDTWLPGSVAHELDHVSRIRTGPGYGNTLGEALVSEGLADHFEYEAFPKTPPQPWDHALTRAQQRSAWRQARPLLDLPNGYDYTAWFVGGGSVPYETGYTLGWDIVAAYLAGHHSPSDAVHVDAIPIIRAFHGPLEA